MGQCQFTAEDDETDMLKKAKTIFEPLIGQACIWNNYRWQAIWPTNSEKESEDFLKSLRNVKN